MINHFFHYLPTDLHLLLFDSWIGNADVVIRVVSALDIACCQACIRPALLSLLRQLMPIGKPNCPVSVLDASFFPWLQARGLPVTSLLLHTQCFGLLADAPFLFPSVDSVLFCYGEPINTQSLARILAACPSLTQLEGEVRYLDPSNADVWAVLPSLAVPQLAALIIATAARAVTTELLRWLTAIGPRIRKLDMKNVPLLAVLGVLTGCYHNLECLCIDGFDEASDENVPAACIVQLLQACKQLKELELSGYNPTQNELDTILTAGRGQLTKLAAGSARLFPWALETHSWLPHLKLRFNEYNRLTGHLNYTVNKSQADLIRRVCGACTHLVTAYMQPEVALIYVNIFGQQLEELQLTMIDDADDTAMVEAVLSRCPRLQRLYLLSAFSDEHLALTAKYCPQLSSLKLWAGLDMPITDAGLLLVFKACSELKELIFLNDARLVTALTLQAVLDCKLRLRKLSCQEVGFSAADVDRFYVLAREQQLLPVPVIEINIA